MIKPLGGVRGRTCNARSSLLKRREIFGGYVVVGRASHDECGLQKPLSGNDGLFPCLVNLAIDKPPVHWRKYWSQASPDGWVS